MALLLLVSVPVAARAAPTQAAPAPTPAKDGPLSPRLADAAGTADPETQRRAPEADPLDGLSKAPDGRIYVDVTLDGGAALAAADALPDTTVEATLPDGSASTLAIPRSQLAALGQISGIRSADAVARAYVDRTHRALGELPATTSSSWACPVGKTTSSGAAQLGAPAARSQYGVRGNFVKVGIISDSFGVDKAAVNTDIQFTADLPGKGNHCGNTTPIQIVADSPTGTDEGRAMAQIVHDMAPGAPLLFADMGVSQIEMANHVRALRDAGARVIVDDITYFDETIYQDGYLAAAVAEVVADGVTYLSSAGNMNLTVGGKSVGSYETQAFRPAPCPSTIGSDSTCHDFDPGAGVSAKDVVTVPAGGTFALNLGWNEAVYDVATDLDLFLLDDASGEVLDYGAGDSVSSGRPIEWAYYENEGSTPKKVRIVVANYGKVGTPRFKSIFFTSGLSAVQWNTAAGGDVFGPTLFGHAGSDATIAVGAMTAASSPSIEAFSTRGPATSCWEPAHGLEPAPAKPCTTKTVDLLGTDGVATSVAGFNPFYGTSAAAPHVAGVAALMAERSTCASPAGIRAALKSGAVPLGSQVHASGAGRTNAPNALSFVDECAEHGIPYVPTLGPVSGESIRVTAVPPADRSSNPISYEVQVVRPGGEVVDTVSGPTGLPGPNAVVDVPVAIGGAYRVRARFEFENTGWTPWSPSSALIVPPFASAAAYMNQLASDFSGRALNDDERQILTFVLGDDYGPGHAAYEASYFEPWSSKIDPVIRLFSAYFGRKPDPSGLNYWLTKRRSGTKLDAISSTFAGSNEFKTKYGTLSNNAFVKLVYQNVLGRAGDAGGINYWTNQLNLKRKSRGQVMTGFSESNENIRRRYGDVITIDLFFGMLRRIPTDGELAEWSPVVAADLQTKDGAGSEALAQHLFTSPEYLDRVS